MNIGVTTPAPRCPSNCLSCDCLLVFSRDDNYHRQDIFVHETGHAIDNVCAKVLIPGFPAAKKDAYDHAKRTGLWNNTYSMRNSGEYFVRMRKILPVTSFLPICTSVRLTLRLILCLSVCLPVGLISMSVCLSVCLSVRLSVCLSVSAYEFLVYPSVCLFDCLRDPQLFIY